MRPRERRPRVVRDVLVELLVLLLGDLALRPRPQRARLVDRLVLVGRAITLLVLVPLFLAHHDRHARCGRSTCGRSRAAASASRNSSSPSRRCSVTSVPRSARSTVSIGVFALAVATPSARRRSAGSPARRVTSVTRSATMNDGVEADAELADQARVLRLVARQRREELARARLGDRADVARSPRRASCRCRCRDTVIVRASCVEATRDPQVGLALVELGLRRAPRSAACRRRRTRWRSARAGRSPCWLYSEWIISCSSCLTSAWKPRVCAGAAALVVVSVMPMSAMRG